jgi:hypothetical protein
VKERTTRGCIGWRLSVWRMTSGCNAMQWYKNFLTSEFSYVYCPKHTKHEKYATIPYSYNSLITLGTTSLQQPSVFQCPLDLKNIMHKSSRPPLFTKSQFYFIENVRSPFQFIVIQKVIKRIAHSSSTDLSCQQNSFVSKFWKNY